MMARPFPIALPSGDAVGALAYPAPASVSLGATLVLAHGAGAPQTHPFMIAFARGLADRGLDVVTFNFLHMERGRRAPDPAARLEAAYAAAIDTARGEVPSAADRLIVGGKSMGGRIASQAVAAADGDLGVAGLVFLGYPLHPPGRPDRLRAAHLPSIAAPMLFVQGSRDAFGSTDELRPIIEGCARATLHVVEGGDHSLKTRGPNALTPDEVYTTVQDAIVAWIRTTVLGSRSC